MVTVGFKGLITYLALLLLQIIPISIIISVDHCDCEFVILTKMRRKPLFYVFNMILPCLLITLVALLGFYIPSDSGEKVTMGITTLLSMTVFLMLVAENMPATSDVLPLVGMCKSIFLPFATFCLAISSNPSCSCLLVRIICFPTS